MQFGSVVNMVTGSKPGTPEVGDGATFLHWSDRSPGTVVEVVSSKEIVVQADNYKLVNGSTLSESQNYEFSPNPDGAKRTFTLRKNGRWVSKGSGMKSGSTVAVGFRDAYYDPTF